MTRWYVKELAELSGISVQTLHHYDHLGLLKPSGHSSKGYRLYGDADLIKLQQIIALKFFGFELKQIKTLLAGSVSMRDHFLAQVSFLEAKAKALSETSAALKKIIKDVDDTSSLPWQSIIKLIEVYHMTEKLENSWVKEILTHEQLKQYIKFEDDLKVRFSDEEKESFHRNWASLVQEISQKMKDDPASPSSMDLASRVMKHINPLYGDEHANLRKVIWEQGFKKGHASNEHGMSEEMVAWLDKALFAYYKGRIFLLLKSCDTSPIKEWHALMKEMFADDSSLENDAVNQLLNDKSVSRDAKRWLRDLYKLST